MIKSSRAELSRVEWSSVHVVLGAPSYASPIYHTQPLQSQEEDEHCKRGREARLSDRWNRLDGET